MATAEPPCAATFLREFPAKNPIHSPSGEKNGVARAAPNSVPASGVATA